MVHGASMAKNMMADMLARRNHGRPSLLERYASHSPRKGRLASKAGLVSAAAPHIAPQAAHRKGVERSLIRSVWRKLAAKMNAVSAFSHMRPLATYTEYGSSAQIHPASHETRSPNV